jgi:multidrug transporter EmrE-like cation transporter
MNLLFSLLAAGAYTVGGLFMRKAEGFAHALPTAMVFGCFGVGAALQILAMRRSELSVNYILVLGLEAALALLLGIGWLGEALSPRKLAGLALILAGVMSLRLEGRPRPAVEAGHREATPQEAPDSRSPTGRRPCQNTNHAPCR